jgi:hypothetical protein
MHPGLLRRSGERPGWRPPSKGVRAGLATVDKKWSTFHGYVGSRFLTVAEHHFSLPCAMPRSDAEMLQCRPRVNDPLSRGIEGTFTSARMLVLRVRRRKNNPHDIQAEIVGV